MKRLTLILLLILLISCTHSGTMKQYHLPYQWNRINEVVFSVHSAGKDMIRADTLRFGFAFPIKHEKFISHIGPYMLERDPKKSAKFQEDFIEMKGGVIVITSEGYTIETDSIKIYPGRTEIYAASGTKIRDDNLLVSNLAY